MSYISLGKTCLVIAIVMITQGTAVAFIEVGPSSALLYIILAAAIALLYCYVALSTKIFGIFSASLLIAESIIMIFHTVANNTTEQSTVYMLIVGVLVIGSLCCMVLSKGNYILVRREKSSAVGTIIQSTFLLLSFVSVVLASRYEFLEPEVISNYTFFIYALCFCLLVSIWIEKTMKLATVLIMIWALYYIYIYIKFAPFDYPLWLSTLVVNVIYFGVSAYHEFSSFQMEGVDKR